MTTMLIMIFRIMMFRMDMMLQWPHCMTMVMIMIDNVDVIADDGDVHEYVDVVDGLGQPNSPGEAINVF